MSLVCMSDAPCMLPPPSVRTVYMRGFTGPGACATSCKLQPRFVVQAGAREVFIALGSGNDTIKHLGVNYNLYGQVRACSRQGMHVRVCVCVQTGCARAGVEFVGGACRGGVHKRTRIRKWVLAY